MKITKYLNTSCAMLGTIAWLMSGSTSRVDAAFVIFSDDFSGLSSNPLNGTAPDIAPGGETWTSSALFNADGSKPSNGNGAAFLPWSPEPGKIYRISADLSPDASASSNWLALGFSQNNDTAQPFYPGSNAAAPWVLHRENGGAAQAFLGPSTAAGTNHSLGAGSINFAIELSTLQGQWSASWYADGQLIRQSSNTYTTNPGITHVGFGALNAATGSIGNFVLAEIGKPVPEPTTLLMMSSGVVLLNVLRRKRYRFAD